MNRFSFLLQRSYFLFGCDFCVLQIKYDFMVVSMGMQLNFNQVSSLVYVELNYVTDVQPQ